MNGIVILISKQKLYLLFCYDDHQLFHYFCLAACIMPYDGDNTAVSISTLTPITTECAVLQPELKPNGVSIVYLHIILCDISI